MRPSVGALSLFASLREEGTRPGHGPYEAPATPADAQLVALAREAPADALEAMYSAYKGRIYTFLLRFLADPEMADDVTQETFTKAYAAFASLTNGHRVLPWLYRIASNAAVDHLRRGKRFRWLRLGAVADTADEPHMRDDHGRVPEREKSINGQTATAQCLGGAFEIGAVLFHFLRLSQIELLIIAGDVAVRHMYEEQFRAV